MGRAQIRERNASQRTLEMILARLGMQKKELAENLGWSTQLLNKRVQVGKFSLDEWKTLCDAMGVKMALSVTYPDGKTDQITVN